MDWQEVVLDIANNHTLLDIANNHTLEELKEAWTAVKTGEITTLTNLQVQLLGLSILESVKIEQRKEYLLKCISDFTKDLNMQECIQVS